MIIFVISSVVLCFNGAANSHFDPWSTMVNILLLPLGVRGTLNTSMLMVSKGSCTVFFLMGALGLLQSVFIVRQIGHDLQMSVIAASVVSVFIM